MSSNTPNLGLLKKDPMVDGNETFNIETMLNENWDKVDEAVGRTGGYGVTTQPKANEYEVNLKPAPASLTAGIRVTVKVNVASTGAPMLNVNGLGSKPVLKTNGSSASFKQDGVYTLVYDGQAFILQGEGGEYGTATAAQVLSGYSIGTENGLVSGTVPILTSTRAATGTAKWPDGALAVYPERGYQKGGAGDGEIKVTTAQLQTAEPALIPKHIKSGTSIFGVAGDSNIVDTADGTIDASSILSGRVGYAKGQRIVGNIAAVTGDTQASAKAVNNGRFHLQPPRGYYDGSKWVYSQEPNLIAANIRKGYDIGGITGNLGAIKEMYSGTTQIFSGEGVKTIDLPPGWDPNGVVLRFHVRSSEEAVTRQTAVNGVIYHSARTFSFSRSISGNNTLWIYYDLIRFESVYIVEWVNASRTVGPNSSQFTINRRVNPLNTLLFASYSLSASVDHFLRGYPAPAVAWFDTTAPTDTVRFMGETRVISGYPASEYWSIQVVEFK